MKKALLIALGMGASVAGFAQRSAIQSASNYLNNDKDYDHAKEYIEKAINDPSTKDDPKAWFVRGNIYISMQQDPKYKAQNPYREAAMSYLKVDSIKQDYEKEAVTDNLLVCAYNYFNDAIAEYNAHNFDQSADFMNQVVKIHDLDGGKRYANNKSFDTIAANAKYVRANSYYFTSKYDQALPIFQDIKNNPLENHPDIYVHLADIYNKQSNNEQYVATIAEGRKRYPSDELLRNEEINYYIKTGKQDELIKKLEDAVAADPKNAGLLYNLGISYYTMAFPKDATGKDIAQPANYTDYISKSEDAYKRALAISPDDAGYNFNLGALYYNEAIVINSKMNAITGTSEAETKKYNTLKAQRDEIFNKAVPYLEKTVSLLEPKANSLSPDDMFSYKNALTSLHEIYLRTSKMDKAAEAKKKLDAVRS